MIKRHNIQQTGQPVSSDTSHIHRGPLYMIKRHNVQQTGQPINLPTDLTYLPQKHDIIKQTIQDHNYTDKYPVRWLANKASININRSQSLVPSKTHPKNEEYRDREISRFQIMQYPPKTHGSRIHLNTVAVLTS